MPAPLMARSEVLVPHALNARNDRDKPATRVVRFMICLPKTEFANSGASRQRVALLCVEYARTFLGLLAA
jgi:hypothetical protein